MQPYRFCPFCGASYSIDQQPELHKHCDACGKWVFENLKTTGSAVVIHDNKLLLVERGIEPMKGKWDVPGGFCDPHEHPAEATRREVQEELGVDCEVGELWNIYSPVPYTYQGYTQHNCDVFYRVTLKSRDIKVGDDAASFTWFPLDQLPNESDMAFISAKQVIAELKSKYPQQK